MDNVYDIKREKKLNFILPVEWRMEQVDCKGKIAVIIHLHYKDTLNEYMRYIQHIPKEIDIYITTSDRNLRNVLEMAEINKRANCTIIEKQNRGRDISSFLVTCRKEILQYDYICFVHDKKEKPHGHKEDLEKWVNGLWENTIGSTEYIYNIQGVFEKQSTIGLLVPPPPMSEHRATAYSNAWGSNFSLAKELAQKMELSCNLDIEKPPIALGTVFWARVAALRKLFEIEWCYEDFDEEPLKDDGTFSHTIERILPYVAQDAGYDTGWIMCDRYAGEQLEYTQSVLRKAFSRLNKSLGIWYIAELDCFEERKARLLEFVEKHEEIYIYGAGKWGEGCLATLNNLNRLPKAFIVSDLTHNPKEVQRIPVYSLDEIELSQNVGVIVAVNKKLREEVLGEIKKRKENFSELFYFERV